jgi:hypothetical protein
MDLENLMRRDHNIDFFEQGQWPVFIIFFLTPKFFFLGGLGEWPGTLVPIDPSLVVMDAWMELLKIRSWY